MSKYKERHFRPSSVTGTVTDDVTVLATAQTTSTFTLTPTRVDTATAGSATGNITADTVDATVATNIQTAIRALGGIYATATCTAGTTDTYIITVFGGYDITWATTATSPTITETGSAGGVTAVPGKVSYTGSIPVGRFAIVKRLRLQGFNDNSLDVSIKDSTATTVKDVFVKTAVDTSTASADTPYDKFLTADGLAGEDGAAAANVSSGLFEGPLTCVIDTSSPVAAAAEVIVVVSMGRSSGLKFRSTGTFLTAAQTVNLGADWANVKRIRLTATSDTSVAPSIADALGRVFYAKTSTSYTTPVDGQLSIEGVDQAANAVADLLDPIVKSPVTVTLTGHDGTGFKVDFYVET